MEDAGLSDHQMQQCHQVCKWPGWYRHITLALLAYAFLAVTRAQAAGSERAKGDTAA